jgi:hypothetical protein
MTFIKARTLTMLVVMAAVAAPVMAAAADATLYELTENMKMTRGKTRRIATSQLMGYAPVGTPLCPKAVIDVLNPGATQCSVNATGSDTISTRTGLGDFNGRFTVVVQGDNPFDGPELVVMSGSFRGRMDFSPTLVKGLPFGTVAGTMSVGSDDDEHDNYRSFPFTGVFRLPFAGNITIPASGVGTVPLRLALCQATPQPNPNAQFYGGYDLAYLDNVSDVGRSTGRCINIHPSEMSLGEATVRFDILF